MHDSVAELRDQRGKRVEFGTRNRNSRGDGSACSFLESLATALFSFCSRSCPCTSSLSLSFSLSLSLPFHAPGRPPEGAARAREGRDASQHLQQQGTVQGTLTYFFLFFFSFRRDKSLRQAPISCFFARPSRVAHLIRPLFLFLSLSSSLLLSFQAKIKSVERIVGPKATGETMHIIIETEGKIPFWEGQSYGVIPPGEFLIFLFSSLFGFFSFPRSVPGNSVLPASPRPAFLPSFFLRFRFFFFFFFEKARKSELETHHPLSFLSLSLSPVLTLLLKKKKKQEPRSTPRARRSATASASTPSPPPATATSSTARPPRSASAAPPTGAPSSRPRTRPRRASAPTSCATPSPATRSR